ncbi:DUF3558 domain-containing protein [Nocardia transvalensis]|uniref:DUF3558 domain-containing protein n=1 Tax=Nocardia transvalensis TaxID=37333 RepID=UPI001895F807|nr:DUF3558 domain-containing protein [Nocardia transvalensis]MBF6329100.1 DUF3558 domain-containing protein [Nocardia transvalensis]
MIARRVGWIRLAAFLVGAAVTATLSVSCGSSTSGNPTGTQTSSTASGDGNLSGKPPFPTLTAPSLQPPQQANRGRPDVVFDPCTWIDDDTMRKLGYSTESRRRHPVADIHGEYTFLSCQFTSPDNVYGLAIMSGNRTWDEGRAKFTQDGARIEDTTIDGRPAMIVRTKSADTCDVLLQTKVGYVDFVRDIAAYLISGPVPERCSGMVDLVRAIIPRIGNN